MKTFIYTITDTKISKTYGGSQQVATIYRIVKNKPTYLGVTQWCTRSYMGEIGEVNKWLLNHKYITIKHAKSEYYHYNDNTYRILEV